MIIIQLVCVNYSHSATVATFYLVSIFVPYPLTLFTAQFTLQLCCFSDDDIAVGKAGMKVNPWI